ncbi:MAG: hypothetical protein ACOC08_05095 [Campylobacterales bacterium]
MRGRYFKAFFLITFMLPLLVFITPLEASENTISYSGAQFVNEPKSKIEEPRIQDSIFDYSLFG